MAYLGVEEADCEEQQVETAGGMAMQYRWTNPLQVEIQHMGAKMEITPAFAKGLPTRLVLLGRRDFFTHFRVTVDERAQTFTLEPYEP
jgi:hypothetical protein